MYTQDFPHSLICYVPCLYTLVNFKEKKRKFSGSEISSFKISSAQAFSKRVQRDAQQKTFSSEFQTNIGQHFRNRVIKISFASRTHSTSNTPPNDVSRVFPTIEGTIAPMQKHRSACGFPQPMLLNIFAPF